MIAKLKGVIDTISNDYTIIDVNGVGYLVYASSKTLSKLIKGATASILIETVVKEDSITLYGFSSAWEKEWFTTLTKVQGVGSKVGLAILSVLSTTQLAQAISAQDKNSFARANGVGPKLAQRIVTELKDKIVIIPLGEVNSVADINADDIVEAEVDAYESALVGREEDPSKLEDAISAMVNLGYHRLEAYKAVNKASSINPTANTGELIRLALKEFVKE